MSESHWTLADVIEAGYMIDRIPVYDDNHGATLMKWCVLKHGDIQFISGTEDECLDYLVETYHYNSEEE